MCPRSLWLTYLCHPLVHMLLGALFCSVSTNKYHFVRSTACDHCCMLLFWAFTESLSSYLDFYPIYIYCLAALLTLFSEVSHWDTSFSHLLHTWVFWSSRLLHCLFFQFIVFIPQWFCVVVADHQIFWFFLMRSIPSTVITTRYCFATFGLFTHLKLFLSLELIYLRLSLWRCSFCRSSADRVNVCIRKCASVASFLRFGEGFLFLPSFPLCHAQSRVISSIRAFQ